MSKAEKVPLPRILSPQNPLGLGEGAPQPVSPHMGPTNKSNLGTLHLQSRSTEGPSPASTHPSIQSSVPGHSQSTCPVDTELGNRDLR